MVFSIPRYISHGNAGFILGDLIYKKTHQNLFNFLKSLMHLPIPPYPFETLTKYGFKDTHIRLIEN
jgi:hypothetical protein